MTARSTRRDLLRQASLAGAALALGGCASPRNGVRAPSEADAAHAADLIVHNARIATLDRARPSGSALAIRGGRVAEVGADGDASVMRLAGPRTRMLDAGGRTVIPGLVDSHLHLIRGGLNYNLELRWDGIPSLAEAMRRLREQAARTPPPQWVRVVGGFTEFQFVERRLPTLAELNVAAPETPVFILHLYDRALLNRAALRAAGITRETPDPPGGVIERDRHGEPTGLLVAKPSAQLLYATLANGPKLERADQVISTRLFMRELNRLGITSAIDAGGGFQRYPDDYDVVAELARGGELTVRIAYNLFTQRPKQELEDFERWTATARPGEGDGGFYRLNGAGEMLVYSATDYEDFREPRPELPAGMEPDLHAVVRHLVAKRWPFRLHATYEESIRRFLDVFEAVDREVPFDGLRWFFDHAETISPRSLERVAALRGGIAVQDRMAFQGERFVERYGPEAAALAPPLKRMLELAIPVGAGSDATRVSSYNPWVTLHWLVSGRTLGGALTRDAANRLDRAEALRLHTQGSAWFSSEEEAKGVLAPGRYADLAVLSADYFSVPEAEIRAIESLLTVVDGRIVHASGPFASLAPPPLPVSPAWSPAALASADSLLAPALRGRADPAHAHGFAHARHAGGGCC